MQITPSRLLMKRLLPAIALEGVALLLCAALYVMSGDMLWIYALIAVAMMFGGYVAAMLFRHRDAWAVTSQKVIR
jgi:hypothetical protein